MAKSGYFEDWLKMGILKNPAFRDWPEKLILTTLARKVNIFKNCSKVIENGSKVCQKVCGHPFTFFVKFYQDHYFWYFLCLN